MTDIERDARELIDAFDGDAAFFAQNLLTGEEVGFRADSVMPTASTIKLLVLAEVIRQAEAGQFALDDPLPMISEDQSGGSGILKDLSPATLLTIRDHATLMIALSDNTSTMALVRLAGRARIEQAGQEWGMTATTLPIDRAPDGDARDYAASTPRDIVHLLQLIATVRSSHRPHPRPSATSLSPSSITTRSVVTCPTTSISGSERHTRGRSSCDRRAVS